MRNLLFNQFGRQLDLYSLNIQRGRDHGLKTYNDLREALGFKKYTKFSEIPRYGTG